MAIDSQLLETLEDAGIRFMIAIPSQFGAPHYIFAASDVLLFLNDPEALYAKHLGVTKEQYRDCVESEYCAFCCGTTKKGHRCKNLVPGGWRVDPSTWVEMQNRYCDLHEGERS